MDIDKHTETLNNTANYDYQCRYIHNKIYSINTKDIKNILFFKMMQVIFNDLQHIAFIINEGFIVDKNIYRYDLRKSFPLEDNVFDNYIKLDQKACFDIKYTRGFTDTIKFEIPFNDKQISSLVDLNEVFKCSNPRFIRNV